MTIFPFKRIQSHVPFTHCCFTLASVWIFLCQTGLKWLDCRNCTNSLLLYGAWWHWHSASYCFKLVFTVPRWWKVAIQNYWCSVCACNKNELEMDASNIVLCLFTMLTHWGLNTMAAISQTTFSNEFINALLHFDKNFAKVCSHESDGQ